MAHTCSYLGDTVSDVSHHMYYRGQRIKEAYYRGEKIWSPEVFLRILLANLPDKLHYAPDEPLDYSGVKILGIWSSGRTEDVTEDCVFYPPEGSPIDLSTVLLGIVLARLPNKSAYADGESFAYGGTVILAVYADGHTEDITPECSFKPAEGSVVRHASVIGIFVTRLPDKSSYAHGQSLNFSGIKVYAAYANGRLGDVTADCSFSPASGSVV